MRIHQPMPAIDVLATCSPRRRSPLPSRHIGCCRRAPRRHRRSPTGSTRGSGCPRGTGHRQRCIATRWRRWRRCAPARTSLVSTPTASGKSLCYNLPVLQAIAEDPAARALYLFPTKALSQDQLAEFRELAGARPGMDLVAAVYDGDTPAPIRAVDPRGRPGRGHQPGHAPRGHPAPPHQVVPAVRAAPLHRHRRGAHAIGASSAATSPTSCAGSLRICAHYGSAPRDRVLLGDHRQSRGAGARRSPGGPFRVIDRNGAPQGEKHVVVLDPPVRWTAAPASDQDRTGLAHRAALALPAGRPPDHRLRPVPGSPWSCCSPRCARRSARAAGRIDRVRGYRSGYLPSERRAIEAGLRTGEVLGVVSTNALELGIDIGRLDVAVLAGYPGTIAATWQQMGRAGRRQESSVAILVAGAGALDRYVASHPEYLFEATAGGGAPGSRRTSTCCSRTCARRRSSCPSTPGERFGSAPGGRPARLPRRGGPCPPGGRRTLVLGQRELPGLGDQPARRRAGERAHHRHRAGAAARHRRGGPLRGTRARPREGHLPPRVAPVPRRRARLGGAQGATSARWTSTTTRRRSWRSRSSRSRSSQADRARRRAAHHGEVMVSHASPPSSRS